jgi:hypothetical protein
MEALLPRVGLSLVDAFNDLDYEPDSLGDRAEPLRRLPRPLVSALGAGVAATSRLLRMEDSTVFITRRAR